MNNLHRELAPITPEAWEQIEEEARRTFTRTVAGRRVVDVAGPSGPSLAGVGTGHLQDITSHISGVRVRRREVQPLIELRVPFTVTRAAVDDVERGAQDSDWQPVKDAVMQMAYAEDRAIFDGFPDAGIQGVRPASSNGRLSLPAAVEDYPDVVARALTELRLAGVDGPYKVLLSADAYTALAETTVQGYPVLRHVARLVGEDDLIWAPAIDGAVVISCRGGDYQLSLGKDLSIGYSSHDAETIELYLEESFTFLPFTAEASVTIDPK